MRWNCQFIYVQKQPSIEKVAEMHINDDQIVSDMKIFWYGDNFFPRQFKHVSNENERISL